MKLCAEITNPTSEELLALNSYSQGAEATIQEGQAGLIGQGIFHIGHPFNVGVHGIAIESG